MLRGYLRPPLATQLFDDRDMFVRTMAEFPRMQPLVARLREGAVEQKLERLQTEAPEFPERYSELLAIRFYIQCVIARCQIQWDADVARGITNYKALFNYIERWRESKYRRVCVVTFSYDTLADDALTEAGRITLRSQQIGDYIAGDAYKLIKLHGSVNWGHLLTGPEIGGLINRGEFDIARELINRAREFELADDEYRIEPPKLQQRFDAPHMALVRPIVRVGHSDTPMAPAIAVPFETKFSFECPRAHREALEACLPEITKIIIVGWRGVETHFLDLLKRIPRPVQTVIVARDGQQAEATSSHLAAAGVAIDPRPSSASFTDFVRSTAPDDFLRGNP